METISISKLKAHLSSELKKVRKGTTITILDHNHPVAELNPISEKKELFTKEAAKPYVYKKLTPLTNSDIKKDLEDERAERW